MPMYKDFFEIDVMKDMGECANVKLPDPTLLDYYKRLKRREILINQEIDDGIVEWTQEIVEWNREIHTRSSLGLNTSRSVRSP